jgi:hypothetical protein
VGQNKPPKWAKPSCQSQYTDEGCRLTGKLVRLFNLTDWLTGVPSYTEAEERAIDYGLREMRRLAGDDFEKMPLDTVETLERIFVSGALHQLASDWGSYDDCPESWKAKVSTYLKVWAMMLDPDVLLELAGLLVLAGYKSEAKATAHIVAAYFPAYAPRYFQGDPDPSLVEHIRTRALEIMREI